MNAERNFCERCGKRLGGFEWDIHTCTLPSDGALIDEGTKAPDAPKCKHCYGIGYDASGYACTCTFPPPSPPPEATTDDQKRAFAFGWWKAMEYVRNNGILK